MVVSPNHALEWDFHYLNHPNLRVLPCIEALISGISELPFLLFAAKPRQKYPLCDFEARRIQGEIRMISVTITAEMANISE